MELTDKLTTDYIIMYINIPTDKGTEHYQVEIEDIYEDIYRISIYGLDANERDLYGRFEINNFYGVLNGYELDEREYLILMFIANRLRLD